ncbi:MAG: NAD(P)-binding domain-containing protein [Nocardioides sp.]|nr:NAD(P)-binding domain-containing protein [Nocardioides sp.]
MPTVDTLVIGAGHAGLATSRLLAVAGHDHVVLERGQVGERWRSERWDSLHLLTPNWMLQLPGSRYGGSDPDGFTPASGFVEMLEAYAASFAAPVVEGTTVEEVRHSERATSRYAVSTDAGTWDARNLVIATGAHGHPVFPAGTDRSHMGPARVIAARDYRNPDLLAPGGVLVVGASASGVQIADELVHSGRQVTLAVGRHTRMPRTYRGMDIYWWLEATGRLARTIEERADLAAARRENSLQLIGRREGDQPDSSVDLGALQRRGVRLTGRLVETSGHVVHLADDLPEWVREADRAMHRFLDAVDDHVQASRLTNEVWPPLRPGPVPLSPSPTRLDLRTEGITTVVVAAGYRPDHPWLRLPILAADGSIAQRRGRTELPGVYTVGQRFQHRRDSAFIRGATYDAAAVVAHLTDHSPEDASAITPESAA